MKKISHIIYIKKMLKQYPLFIINMKTLFIFFDEVHYINVR